MSSWGGKWATLFSHCLSKDHPLEKKKESYALKAQFIVCGVTSLTLNETNSTNIELVLDLILLKRAKLYTVLLSFLLSACEDVLCACGCKD